LAAADEARTEIVKPWIDTARIAQRFNAGYHQEMKIDDCNALITGASAGIGREFARQIAGRARSLILVARREQELNELRDELRQRYPNLTVRIRKTDLADLAQLKGLMAWLDYEKINVDLLINNAGLGDSGPFVASDPIRNEQMMRVNMVALTSLTRHLLPPMTTRRCGAILNVSSSAGFLPIPGFAIYAATKAYVTSFSEALRAELHGTGVSVCALCPGPVHTEFQEVAKRPGGQRQDGPEFVHVSVEQVVRDALTGLEADRPLVIPGLAMKIIMLLVRITPMPILRWVSRFSKL
jgi:short-subunit dehydrogenase